MEGSACAQARVQSGSTPGAVGIPKLRNAILAPSEMCGSGRKLVTTSTKASASEKSSYSTTPASLVSGGAPDQ